MVINENNSHINSFTKGMNSDTAYDQIQNTQYTYGQNIRITKNLMLGGASDYSTLREGIVTPVPEGQYEKLLDFTGILDLEILATDSIDDISVLICSDDNNSLRVFKLLIDVSDPENSIYKKEIWQSPNFFKDDKDVSILLYKELDNVIKLYIASAEYPVIVLRVDEEVSYYNEENDSWRDKDYLMNNRVMPRDTVYIDDVIDGRLITSLVLYTYRFYNKYCNSTQLAPLTNKILVISPVRNKEAGNAENTETSIGFTIKIPVANYKDKFDRILVYRLSYIKPNEDSEIALIYDDKIKEVDDQFILNDVGIDPLLVLTIEEFSAMSGLILKPRSIETNQLYMFCSNVEDDTIIKVRPASQNCVSPVITEIVISDTTDGTIPYVSGNLFTSVDNIKDLSYNNIISVPSYFEQRGINYNLSRNTYNNIFASSLLRSLRRGEDYKYGIVYYDSKGRRSDVHYIGSVNGNDTKINPITNPTFISRNGKIFAVPIGVKINVPQPITNDDIDIIGCQIVRRSSSEIYLKTLLLVALSRPILLGLMTTNDDYESEQKSPFYPTGFLSTDNIVISPPYYRSTLYDLFLTESSMISVLGSNWSYNGAYTTLSDDKYLKFLASTQNKTLFLIFSSEIDFRRDDILDRLNVSDINIDEVLYTSSSYKRYGNIDIPKWQQDHGAGYFNWEDGLRFFGKLYWDGEVNNTVFHRDLSFRLSPSEKQNIHWVFNYFTLRTTNLIFTSPIKSVKDVKIPGWNDGFTNVERDSDYNITDAIKKYKLFTTTIDQNVYNNWVSFCKYDLKPGKSTVANQTSDDWNKYEFLDRGNSNKYKYDYDVYDSVGDHVRDGYIGPGSSCFLISTEQDFGTSQYSGRYYESGDLLHTSICNITHSPKTDDVESDEQTMYYGFGNYFKLKKDNGQYKVENRDGILSEYMIVFDGDIYITPHEFTTMYKAYNFESSDTLQSTLITNYIPLESKVNTYFDYGMNLRNTESANLIYEPGLIEGVITQERPAHQYNMIYSDNDASNDVFTLISTDEDETNKFPQRTYFSEPKTNGEFIDNFLIFKPASFIDVEGTYGLITELATNKNILYYWQEQAFGKFSVNERSLINDTNGNTIMLGQAGILSRYDYIDTRYGMREGDRCECPVDKMIYWVDINNKAIVAGNTEQAVNYGEHIGVLNIINDKISSNKPYVHHDLLNDELLCKCLKDGQLIVFNTKYNLATSVYTRDYDDILNVKNHLYTVLNTSVYGRRYTEQSGWVLISKINYLNNTDDITYLSPVVLSFVINPNASITKVFDSQLIVPIKRNNGNIDNLLLSFETDLYTATKLDNKDCYTDREGNIIYNVPRWGNEPYGNRIRGKWMKVEITKETNITDYDCLSHVITKFRQSFS